MKIIFDNDATVVDYRKFVDKYAVAYFKRKHGLEIIYENKLEIEDIFDIRNTLIDQECPVSDLDMPNYLSRR